MNVYKKQNKIKKQKNKTQEQRSKKNQKGAKMEEITQLTVHELLEKIDNNELTANEIVEAYKKRIDKYEKDINAFISIATDEELAADNLYKNVANVMTKVEAINEDGIEDVNAMANKNASQNEKSQKVNFAGIPIGIKDNLNVVGTKTTCASKMLENYVSPYDATVVKKLKEAGLVSLGKLNMDEFAMGSSTENSAFKVTRNPWNLKTVPGGSSGGSAAAVAADMVPWALGSDTGGSIREPASFCGIVGLKPTYGLVSRYGLVAFASSLDQIGPMTKDVRDNAMLLNLIAGYDEKDSTSYDVPKVDYTQALKTDVKGMKIGVPKEFFGEGINEEVKAKLKEAIEVYKDMGAEVEECSLNVAEYALATYYIIACAEASSNLGRFDGIRYGYRTTNASSLRDIFKNSRTEGFGPEVKRRIILGTYVLSSGYYDAYYKKAQKVRTYVKEQFDKCFEKYDILITPVAPTTAFEIGSKVSDPMAMYLADICTVSINIASVPAMSLPCGVDKNGMPIGMQIIANRFDEEKIYNAAYAYEQKTKFREKYKPEFKNN